VKIFRVGRGGTSGDRIGGDCLPTAYDTDRDGRTVGGVVGSAILDDA
jgi:hypothetical protein